MRAGPGSPALAQTLAATFAALLLGYVVQRVGRRWPEGTTDRWSARLKHLLVLYATPLILLLSFWKLELQLWMITLPLLGILGHLAGGLLGLGVARRLGLARPQTGSMFVCGMMSNLTSFGGLVSYLFFGETGFALGAVYRVFEPIVVHGVGFPVSAALGGRRPPGEAGWVRRVLLDPYVLLPNAGLAAGILLNALEVRRPAWVDPLSPVLIVTTSLAMVFAIGLTLRPARLSAYVAPALAVAGIKFVALPVVMALAAAALGYTRMADPLPFKIVVLMAAMPVAFNALVPPTLFGLDLDLANSAWLVTTLGFFAMLPILYVVLV